MFLKITNAVRLRHIIMSLPNLLTNMWYWSFARILLIITTYYLSGSRSSHHLHTIVTLPKLRRFQTLVHSSLPCCCVIAKMVCSTTSSDCRSSPSCKRMLKTWCVGQTCRRKWTKSPICHIACKPPIRRPLTRMCGLTFWLIAEPNQNGCVVDAVRMSSDTAPSMTVIAQNSFVPSACCGIVCAAIICCRIRIGLPSLTS